MNELQKLAQAIIEWGALTLLFVFGIAILAVIVIYLVDITQTKHTLRRNYPVVGHLRYFSST